MPVSMHGLDLSWMSNPANLLPPRPKVKKYRPPNKRSTKVACPYFMPDVDAVYGGSWKSIIDDTEISSRANWREHNKRNGVLEVGPGYWGETKERDICDITAERMGYDPSLINSDIFSWKEPESVRESLNGSKGSAGRNSISSNGSSGAGKRGRRGASIAGKQKRKSR